MHFEPRSVYVRDAINYAWIKVGSMELTCKAEAMSWFFNMRDKHVYTYAWTDDTGMLHVV